MTRTIVLSTLSALALIAAAGGVTLAAQTPQTPTQVYMAYRAAFDKATKMEDIRPFLAKKGRAEMDAMPAKERPEFFKMIKDMGTMATVKVSKETMTETGATLLVDAVNPNKVKMTCEVTMVKEDGAFKIAVESWGAK
ncbi:MAG TPA: hypothetical protein VF732_08655 [Nitrospira sp.]